MSSINQEAARRYLKFVYTEDLPVISNSDALKKRQEAVEVMLGVLREEEGAEKKRVDSQDSQDADIGHLDLTKHDKRFHGGRFDDQTMSCKLRNDLEKADNPDTALADHELKMAGISGKNVDEYVRLLGKKRPDLDAEDVLIKIADIDDKKIQGDAFRWLLKGAVRLPEDLSKVKDARAYAERAKKDPFSYDTPQACVNDLHEFKPKGKPIDPDTVPELSDKKTFPMGVTTYAVQDDREGQQAMRKIINTHWGEDANPWCLLQGDGHGNLSDGTNGKYDAWHYWHDVYTALPKRVAFKNGKLLAFMATDGERYDELDRGDVEDLASRDLFDAYEEEIERNRHADIVQTAIREFPEELREIARELGITEGEQWWDRQDASHEGIPLGNIPVPGDAFGRWADFEIVGGDLKRVGEYVKRGKHTVFWNEDGSGSVESVDDQGKYGAEFSKDGRVNEIRVRTNSSKVLFEDGVPKKVVKVTGGSYDVAPDGQGGYDVLREDGKRISRMSEYGGYLQNAIRLLPTAQNVVNVNAMGKTLREIADEAIRESEMVEAEDGGKELERLKQMVRMRKISKADFKTGLAGLYAAGLITMNQFDVAKRQFR